jgi:hypothetical protein
LHSRISYPIRVEVPEITLPSNVAITMQQVANNIIVPHLSLFVQVAITLKKSIDVAMKPCAVGVALRASALL